ncbi:MAG: hypothetical protein NTW91_10315 [Verrucomicrobia bacterium]|nr:hypothetical protein [Verrucomicrobiota bacterium]
MASQSNMQGYGNLNERAKPHPLHLPSESPDVCHNGGRQCSREEADAQRRGVKGTGVEVFLPGR